MIRLTFVIALTTWSFAAPAVATEIRIHHSVIRKALTEQVFTDEGRKYIKASRAEKCNYAYLENPEIDSDKGQLRIRARFTGRSARDVFGRCIGFGDSFVALIHATPYYKDGAIRVKDVRVESEGSDGFYIRHARSSLARGLPDQFSYRIYDDAKRVLEEPRPNSAYRQQLVHFDIPQIRVTDEAIVLVLDFALAVR